MFIMMSNKQLFASATLPAPPFCTEIDLNTVCDMHEHDTDVELAPHYCLVSKKFQGQVLTCLAVLAGQSLVLKF